MTFFHFLDLFGTLVFALAGAFKAVKYELDILGVLILAVFTGVGGGIIRDLILGQVPPGPFTDESYFVLCLLGGVLVYFLAPRIARWWDWIKFADAIGLGVFAALGAAKGVEAGLGPLGTVMAGAITATGGGVIRDILVREMPVVIHADFYATAAALGSLVYYGLDYLGVDSQIALSITIIFTIVLRLVAMKYNLHLPKVRRLPLSPGEISLERKKTKHKK
ncbi:MAG: hypothetical protein A2Z96_05440 [Spirochaetes bacterium GWB1_48_6]|nr:MAG: hypothetical protein A2Z96_05440 [Spirochaetes bacterium GWB1_48_6]